MKIGVDIDGVISDFIKNFRVIVREAYNIDLQEQDIYVHDLNLVLGISKIEAFDLVLKCLTQDLELIEGAKEGLIQLYKDHEVYILTARPKELNGRTEKWLKKNNIPYHKLIHLNEGNKHMVDVRLDIIIEDNLTDAINWIGKSKVILVYDHFWNKSLNIGKLFKRVHSWTEIIDIISETQKC
ncbi:5' nucleotidase, deoxy (Pyrimidine), cytosolic type C protein (NT5C) [uncultured archaeon]|nr:5' nucleotidase, deoxy (Pyrimidine), cytosolic type C protein (NT5C) [uncultured archaeon]